VTPLENQNKNLIDAHCHLTDDRVWPEAREWIARAQGSGLKSVRIGGLYPSEWPKQIELQKEFPDFIRTSFGLHPWWIEKSTRAEIESNLKKLEADVGLAQAIGETGLDFFSKRDPARFADQEFAFRAQLRLALAHQKPVVLHVVKAHEVVQKMIREEKAESLRFQVHSFSGSAENARAWVKLGAFLSFSGSIVRENGSKLRQTLKAVPRAQILLETDAPDQAWRRDGQNEPAFIGEIYRSAAQVLDLPLSYLTAIVAENFDRFG
jgi:TatD DNase family protein